MAQRVPTGYYRDTKGELKRDRRQTGDRRKTGGRESSDGDRRLQPRRAADREFIEREHQDMIEEALAEFAAEHEHF